jgi:hypothetical protein
MHSVRVNRTGITAEQAAEVIRRGLGEGYAATAAGEDQVEIRKGVAKAKVVLRPEAGGTIFEVSGQGTWLVIPFSYLFTRAINERGIANRVADAVDAATEFGGTA